MAARPSNADLQRQLDKFSERNDKDHGEIKETMKSISMKLGELAPIIAAHEERIKSQEQKVDNMEKGLWATAIVAVGAIISRFLK